MGDGKVSIDQLRDDYLSALCGMTRLARVYVDAARNGDQAMAESIKPAMLDARRSTTYTRRRLSKALARMIEEAA